MEDKKITEKAAEAAENVKEEAEKAKETVAEKAEEVKEAVAQKTEEVKEAVEEKAEEVKEAVEEKAEAAKEAVEEKVEEAKAAAEEVSSEEIAAKADEAAEAEADALSAEAEGSSAAEAIQAEAQDVQTDIAASGADTEEQEIQEAKAEETAVEAAVEDAKADAEPKKAGSPVKEPPIIKKKKKLDKVNVIVIAVCAVIVIACLLFVGIKLGWFKGKPANKMTMGDYSTIEVLSSAVEVSDEMVDQYIDSILQSQTVTEEVTEGVVEDGDVLNIDYVGKLAETGEEFAGGSAQGKTLQIGSGTMIDGFESGLIGAKIGETTTIKVTFPEDYQSTDLAGKDATFDVTINSKSVSTVPELTDEFVQNYSKNYLEVQLNTVEELKDYAYNYIYTYYLHNAMFEDLQSKQTVISYDEEKEAMLMEYSKNSVEYYAAMYGTTAEQYVAMYGATSVDEYTKQEADYYLDTIMLVDKIIKDKNITWTEEEFRQAVALYMARNGYSEMYTVDEFLEKSGETWRYLFENMEFKFNLAMEALEPNVVFVDQKSGTEEESSAETESSEAETESAAN